MTAEEPRSIKIIFISGLLTSFVLYTAYCGSLVSTLSTPVVPISNFQDILNNKFEIYGEPATLVAEKFIKVKLLNPFISKKHLYFYKNLSVIHQP